MKKVSIVLVILIILGGVGFFFGWVQLTVPIGAYGILRSKTHGIDPQVIRDGEFRWVWYKLIPTNVDIQVFTLNNIQHALKIKDELPSGKEYAFFAGFAIDFSYEMSATLSFNIKPSSLSSIISNQSITSQEDLEAFEARLVQEIEAFALQRLRVYTEDAHNVEEILQSGSLVQLNEDIVRVFPDIDNFSCFMYTTQFPDLALYQQFRSLHKDYVERQQEYLRTEDQVQPEQRINLYMRFDELTKYGELLTKYPILLQFLALEKGQSISVK